MIDEWFETPTDETLIEFVSVRATMDELACQSVYQMCLADEAAESMRRAEEEMKLVVEKQQGVVFEQRLPDYGWYFAPSHGTFFFNAQQQQLPQNLPLGRGLLGGIGGFLG